MVREPDAELRQVVIVDDDEPVLRALGRALADEPFELRTTTFPEEALEWVRTERINVLVADYRMPAQGGIELLREAKRVSPNTARILLTGHPGEGAVMRGLGEGLYWLVGKPWDDESLKKVVRWFLRAALPADLFCED